jgi:Bacterial regulatory helix-turn-helix proteins, AraC family
VDFGGACPPRTAIVERTSFSIEQVASAVGLRSASVLREHFGGIVGTTPLAYRRAFGNAKTLEVIARRAVPVVPGHEVFGNPPPVFTHDTLRAAAR